MNPNNKIITSSLPTVSVSCLKLTLANIKYAVEMSLSSVIHDIFWQGHVHFIMCCAPPRRNLMGLKRSKPAKHCFPVFQNNNGFSQTFFQLNTYVWLGETIVWQIENNRNPKLQICRLHKSKKSLEVKGYCSLFFPIRNTHLLLHKQKNKLIRIKWSIKYEGVQPYNLHCVIM